MAQIDTEGFELLPAPTPAYRLPLSAEVYEAAHVDVAEPATPGSPEAVQAGCRCAKALNRHGLGQPRPDGKPWYVTNSACPIHGK
jgi:hypothetical protein